jgi:hypothetical protein
MKLPIVPDGLCSVLVVASSYRYGDFHAFRELTLLLKPMAPFQWADNVTFQVHPGALPYHDESAMRSIESQRAIMNCSLIPAAPRWWGLRRLKPRPIVSQSDVKTVIAETLREAHPRNLVRVGYVGGEEIAQILRELGYNNLIKIDTSPKHFDSYEDYGDGDTESDIGFWPRTVCPYHLEREGEEEMKKTLGDDEETGDLPYNPFPTRNNDWRFLLYHKGCNYPLCTRALAESLTEWMGLEPNDYEYMPWEGLTIKPS